MKLLILDGPRHPGPNYSPTYRGTARRHPSHCDAVPDDHEINKLFFWFLEEGGELGVVRDVPKALRLAELWNARLPKEGRFEVVEVTDANTPPESSGLFLGFDLSAGYNNSLLEWGLKTFAAVSRLPMPIREFSGLVSRHYAPQLNAQGLFQTAELATLCLRSLWALQDLSPNMFEGTDLREFKVIALCAIPTPVAPQSGNPW